MATVVPVVPPVVIFIIGLPSAPEPSTDQVST